MLTLAIPYSSWFSLDYAVWFHLTLENKLHVYISYDYITLSNINLFNYVHIDAWEMYVDKF